jgi:hypothetical protein
VHTYIFNTDLGAFEITNAHPSNHHHRMYELWLEDEKLGEYATAEEAAADVAGFNTGYVEWDNLESDGVRVPETIGAWTEVFSNACEDAEDLELRDIAESPFLGGEAEG